VEAQLLALAGGGVVGGLVLLGRGFGGYRDAARITDTSPSRIGSIAVGEVLVTGTVEPGELTLVSPLQSEPCVFYRSRIVESGDDDGRTMFREEAAVGFRVRDDSGEVRVFPRDARFDVPAGFDERTSPLGDPPAGLRFRSGPAFGAPLDRDAQIAALFTVHPAAGGLPGDVGGRSPGFASGFLGSGRGSRHYIEARIQPGETVTIVGRAMPFDQLADPVAADTVDPSIPAADDPEIAADLAAARTAGTLVADPDDAWGNAAIPGFGIGRPVREPELDDAATEPPLASIDDAARYRRTFEIAPDALILAASPDSPLVIAIGAPSVAAGRREREFLIGLLGAVVAIGSAMALGVMLGGGLG
jgi:hypothetical protein